jgi:hypothetical protein
MADISHLLVEAPDGTKINGGDSQVGWWPVLYLPRSW